MSFKILFIREKGLAEIRKLERKTMKNIDIRQVIFSLHMYPVIAY